MVSEAFLMNLKAHNYICNKVILLFLFFLFHNATKADKYNKSQKKKPELDETPQGQYTRKTRTEDEQKRTAK